MTAPIAFRLGAGAGFAGDRIDPAVDLVNRGHLDALVFECLAERTITLAQQERAEGRGPGYDRLLRERLTATMPAARRQNTVVVTNSGAANPRGAAEMAIELTRQLGIDGTVVAAVDGDDVLDQLRLADCPVLGTTRGETLADYGDRIVSANAYLGVQGILEALQSGAHVVLTGRTSDAALFLGPLLHAFGWPPTTPATSLGYSARSPRPGWPPTSVWPPRRSASSCGRACTPPY